MATVANLQRISVAKLSELLLASHASSNPTVAVVDVRDDGAYQYRDISSHLTATDY